MNRFSPFLGRSVWVDIAAVGKVCVGIFLILSGFGLTKSFERKHETGFRFALKHIGKLYAEFWFVFFLSLIPLFFNFNGQNFISVWGREWCKPFVINMSGLQYFWNEWGYNPTWWFMSLILGLYALFPLLYAAIIKYGVNFLFLCFVLSFVPVSVPVLSVLSPWVFAFVTGIFFARHTIFDKIKNTGVPTKLSCFIFTAGLVYIRLRILKNLRPYSASGSLTGADVFLALSIIATGFLYTPPRNRQLTKAFNALVFIGKHSMNIFLVHTFFLIYFRDFVYAPKYPPLIFLLFLGLSLSASVLIEKLKRILMKGTRFLYKRQPTDAA